MNDYSIDTMVLMATVNGGRETVRMTADMEDMESILFIFERFLQAAGYHIPGDLTFTNKEEQQP